MLIKVFAHGKGSGNAAVNYLLRMDYYGRQEHPPIILRGDPETTKELINSIDRKWKFTAGVCSWSGEDTVTPEQETEVITRFEELAFAGLEHDQYNILWVRHRHANHHELHFVIPRLELPTVKAFNAFPPGWEKDFGHFRDYMNIKHNWTRPNDPDRKRMFTPSNADIIEARLTRWKQNPTRDDKEHVRTMINNFVKENIENGLIHDRADIINNLQEVGLEINREGKDYISVKDPDSEIMVRLKGGVYEHQWTITEPARQIAGESNTGVGNNQERIRREFAEHEQGLTEVIRKRAIYNEKRYHCSNSQDIKKIEERIPHNEQSICRHMADQPASGNSNVFRHDSGTALHNGLENRKYSSRKTEIDPSKSSYSRSQDGHSEIIKQDRGGVPTQKFERDIRSFQERSRPNYILRDKRPPSYTSQIAASDIIENYYLNNNANQGDPNNDIVRDRSNSTRNDRSSTQRPIKSNQECSQRSDEQFRDMENRANEKVGAYNKRIRQIRELCQCIRDITSNLLRIADNSRRNEQSSIATSISTTPDITEIHDFER